MPGVHGEEFLSQFRWERDEKFQNNIASEGRRVQEQEESISQLSKIVAPGRDGG